MKIELGYGKGKQVVDIPDENIIDILYSNNIKHSSINDDAILYSLNNPIGDIKLSDKIRKVSKNSKITIITSDITRPLPSKRVIPHVLNELRLGGVDFKNITIVFALGAHRNQTKEEQEYLVGSDIFNQIKCVDSTPCDTISYGFTKRGTPIEISRIVAESDFVICIGNVEFHYFAGYSGGAKALMPGVASIASIEHNHKMMLDQKAAAGNILCNPIRDDIEEAANIVGIDYIVNVVLDENKNIVYAACGNYIDAHRACCEYINKMYLKPICSKADIVIVSQGGFPKDINLYQLQKALDNAKSAVKENGTIILVGECSDGFGNTVFEKFLKDAINSNDIIKSINNKFVLGGHKACAIALVLEYADIDLVSSIDKSTVKDIFMKPFNSVQDAFDIAFKKYGADSKVLVMPYGGSTLPQVK